MTRATKGPQNVVMFSNLAYVQEQLAKHPRTEWHRCCDVSGVPFSTLKKLAYKQTTNPTSKTVERIAAYFRVREKRRK